MSFRRGDVRELSAEELRSVYELDRARSLETWPDDGFLDLNSWTVMVRARPAEHRSTLLLAPGTGRLAGMARVSWEEEPENRHLAGVDVVVDPGARRQGLGRRLLLEAAAVAQAAGRNLLVGGASTRTPSGVEFARSVGATLGLVEHENRLRTDDLDRGLLAEWLRPAPGYRPLAIDGPTPAELLPQVARVQDVMNDAPRGDIEWEDSVERPERLAERERGISAAGFHVWSVYAQHEASGELVGFTRLSWHPALLPAVEQWGTAVAREHRGHGLGRLLKAVNLDRLLREIPRAREVSTTNASTNRWMLAINHALGFRQVAEWQRWQLQADKLLA